MQECTACATKADLAPIPRWKAPLLVVGALLFCPCHLPITFAFLAAALGGLTGAAWLFSNQVLVYAVFSLVYLVLLFFLVRWLLASRARERSLVELHHLHGAEP